ncbi:MAG: alanine racemase, partial [Acidobacteria bacterium CG_4_9_14_3_um_filter_49_7]
MHVNMNNGLPLEQHPASWIELSEQALRRNIHYLKRRIGKRARFCSVIKGNAYGHGTMQFIDIAERAGVDFFAVFDAYEAEQALQARRDTSDIMVMGMMDHSAVTWAVEKGISFYVFDADRMETAIRSAKACGRPARIHLELET